MIDYQEHITIEAGKRSGQPCIRVHRITAYDILSYIAAEDLTKDILDHFSMLTREDILACLGICRICGEQDAQSRFLGHLVPVKLLLYYTPSGIDIQYLN